MSYLVAATDSVATAADNLAGIRASLLDAASTAAGPTTAIAAAAGDEISAAITQIFGSYGEQFLALSTQASEFHAEFVRLLNGGAAAYAAAETLNTAPLQLAAPAAPVGSAYQDLFARTQANLHLINQTWAANPAPLLSQIVANQQGYARTVGTAFQSAAQDFAVGLTGLPAAYQTAFQAFAAGNVTAGVQALGRGYLNLVFTGFDYSNVPAVTLNGALGDLLPILSIPGQVAQNTTNLLTAVTDTSITTVISLLNPSFTTGLPLTLALDALGAPIVTAQAAAQSGATLLGALQAGDVGSAIGAIVDAPAVIANGFLNGQATITLDLPTSLSPIAGTQSISASIPIGGILAPPLPVVATATVRIFPLPPVTQQLSLGGTRFGGLIPGLLGASAQLASLISPAA